MDRLRDTIRRRGENISSFEIEQAMLPMHGIVECAAVAVSADGEAAEDEIMLFVVPAPGAPVEPAQIWDWADGHLPRFARPRYLKLVDSMPKTPSERVRKAELRKIGEESDRFERPG